MNSASSNLFVEFAVVATAMSIMLKTGFRYKVLRRKPLDRCASCGRLLPSECSCRS
jgi:hypothetical protein